MVKFESKATLGACIYGPNKINLIRWSYPDTFSTRFLQLDVIAFFYQGIKAELKKNTLISDGIKMISNRKVKLDVCKIYFSFIYDSQYTYVTRNPNYSLFNHVKIETIFNTMLINPRFA